MADDTLREPELIQQTQTFAKPVLSSATARQLTIENLNKLKEIEDSLEASLINGG